MNVMRGIWSVITCFLNVFLNLILSSMHRGYAKAMLKVFPKLHEEEQIKILQNLKLMGHELRKNAYRVVIGSVSPKGYCHLEEILMISLVCHSFVFLRSVPLGLVEYMLGKISVKFAEAMLCSILKK